MSHHLLDIVERCTPKRYFLTLCLILPVDLVILLFIQSFVRIFAALFVVVKPSYSDCID